MPTEVVVAAPANNLGYGVVAVNVVSALTRVGVDAYYRPWPPDMPLFAHEDIGMYAAEVYNDVQAAYARWNKHRPDHLPHLHIWHEWQCGGPWIGPTIAAPFFETVPIRADAVPRLQACQRVIATSAWAKTALAASGIESDHVQFVGFDPGVFHPRNRTNCQRQDFTFLHVGKYEIRKGIDVLLQAFGKLSREHDDVVLWLMVDNPFHERWYGELIKLMVSAGLDTAVPRVHQLHRRIRHQDVARLYRLVDAMVQPSRGEGWGLPTVEGLACGTPVAATTNTGQGDFVQQLNGIAIPSGELVPAFDGVFFDGSRKWYDVKASDVYIAMKQLYTTRPVPDAEASRFFTWQAGAKRLATYIESL